MEPWWRAWSYIVAGLLAYVMLALAASVFIRRVGGNVKDVEGRLSPAVLAIGAAANLCILGATLLLLRFLVGRPIVALGLSYGSRDLAFCLVAWLILPVLAVAFVAGLARAGRVRMERRSPAEGPGGVLGMLAMGGTLGVVALQEEVLFRGYMTLDLAGHGPVVVLAVTTLLFAAIHVLTNRVDRYQLVGWVLGGALLGYAYLLTGSIWVPVAIHFAMDLVNVLFLDIVRHGSVVGITPTLTPRHRVTYRAVSVAAVVVTLLVFFGPDLAYGG
ncbi:MAG: type II CAAX endopeptidase family protein [Gemmatimonadota bacterium]|jgi:membrane protease YdiL (CAAX protease family)